MFALISIPPTLQPLCGGDSTLQVSPGTLGEIFTQLHQRFNGIRERLCDANGRLRGSVLVFVNEQDVRFLQGEQTVIQCGDAVTIIPAFAGG